MVDDSTGFSRETGRERRQRDRRDRAKRQLFWTFGSTIFIGLLILAGWGGIRMAESDLPESARREAGYPIGVVAIAGRDGDPVYLADTVQHLRDFYFKYPTSDKRREADAETMKVRRIFGRVEVATLKSDADAVKVTVKSGPLVDTMYWIHRSQLP